ncbi:YggS family pyridoxal phosphate-dependent enzyme [Halanaerobium salsuginis]|uniref:Pyridoxal phosphate homeostasis protein n=1 Tax=Halanaerobium salsuginis TaxID=29563 RepID=A0A1I4GF74_9FIRM|nr:YggS family pyridoxal phosphate-dependent enzyme [Halanaerobium salsuginis]SFL28655.1 hypothetical protein SAMN02983006_00723 [Halanaerobium salsuginis]
MNQENILANLTQIKQNIKAAAEKANRNPESIKLLPVTKNHGSDSVKILTAAGLNTFAESRVQELEEKEVSLNSANLDLNWHFIGHLQRNKVKYLMRMENCKLIHSLDSWRLAKEINKRAAKNQRVMPVLVEINIAGDENKYGIKAEQTEKFFNKIIKLENLEVKGMMTILPHLDDQAKLFDYFKEMKELYDYISNNVKKLEELSMGMSNDYQLAVAAGATIVRVGTALLGAREY